MKEVASVAFWAFIAVVVIANVWREVAMRRETEMTIRMALEKGQQLDAATVDQLLTRYLDQFDGAHHAETAHLADRRQAAQSLEAG